MVSREMVKEILTKYFYGKLTKEEVSDWAYIKLAEEQCDIEDDLVTEVLYNLVSFHNVGLIFAQYRPCQEKLKYLHRWLECNEAGNWEDYKEKFKAFKTKPH